MFINTNNQYHLLAFQLNYIYQNEHNFNSKTLNKIYLTECNQYLFKKIVTKIKKQAKKDNNFILQNKKYGEESLNLIKKSGFFNSLTSIETYINNFQYTLFKLKLNPIIKKIDISNNKTLCIPQKILIRYLQSCIGMPINYIDINISLKSIQKWYCYQGFKWVNFYYVYYLNTKTLILYIHEGKVRDIKFVLKKDQNYKFKELSKIKFNRILKNELNIYDGQQLNTYFFELKLLSIKEKYFFYNIKYDIKYYSSGLIIYIEYVFFEKNYFLLKLNFLTSNNNFDSKNILSSKLIHVYQTYLIIKKYFSKSFILFSLDYLYTYNTSLKNYINYLVKLEIFYKICIFKLTILFLPINIYLFLYINIYLSYISRNKFFYNLYTKNNIKINFKLAYPYLYDFVLYNLKIKIKYKNLAYQEIFIRYHYFLNKYVNIIHYLYYKDYVLLTKIKNIKINKYLIKYNHLTLPYLSDIVAKINYFSNIYLETIIYSLKSYYIQNKFYHHYIHNLRIDYYNSIFFVPIINSKLKIIFEINLIIGKFNKYMILIEDFRNKLYNFIIQQRYNIFFYMEYSLIAKNNIYIYLITHYSPQLNPFIMNSINKRLTKNILIYPINIGIGIQIQIPIQYTPKVRLEYYMIKTNRILIHLLH